MAYDPNDPNSQFDEPDPNGTQAPSAGAVAQPGQRYSWQNSQAGRNAYGQVAGAYRQYLGRDGSADEIWNSHLNWDRAPDSNFMSKILGNLSNSDEAKAYRNRPTAAAPTAPTPPPPPPSPTGSPVTDTGKIAPAAPPAPTYTAKTPLPSAYTPGMVSQYQAPDPSVSQDQMGALLQAVQGGGISQFSGPNQQGTEGQAQALMNALLANPQTMNANVIAQMKEAQKQQALLMGQQNQSQLDNAGISRGTLGAGAHASMTGQNLQDTMGQLLDANRGIDIQALAQNRQDELNALGASDSFLNNQLSRATQGYNTQLNGQQAEHARALSALSANDSVLNNQTSRATQNYGATLQGQQLQQALAQAGAQSQLGLYNADLATELGRSGQQLNFLQYMENQRQFNGQLGFNYNSLDQQGQQAMLNWLAQMGL